MKSLKADNASPHSAPTGACAYANEHRKKCSRAKHDTQLGCVPRRPPERAEVAVRVLAVVFLAIWERAARVVGVSNTTFLAWARKVDDLPLAAFEQTVANDSLRAEYVGRVCIKPSGTSLGLRALCKRFRSIPPVRSNDRQDVLYSRLIKNRKKKRIHCSPRVLLPQ